MNHELSKTLPLFTYGSLMENFFNYELYLKDRIKEKPQKARMKGELYHLDTKAIPLSCLAPSGFMVKSLNSLILNKISKC